MFYVEVENEIASVETQREGPSEDEQVLEKLEKRNWLDFNLHRFLGGV